MRDTKSEYEWQLRAYMMLYDRGMAELVYCMVTTWDEYLNEWENLQLHRVDHIDPEKRITVLWWDRDEDKEIQMIERLKLASEYYDEYFQQLKDK
jgi:predicted MarR family transcription regulator